MSIFTTKHLLLNACSICFDAFYVAPGKKSIDKPRAESASMLFINKAYQQCNTIDFGKLTAAFGDLTNVKRLKRMILQYCMHQGQAS